MVIILDLIDHVIITVTAIAIAVTVTTALLFLPLALVLCSYIRYIEVDLVSTSARTEQQKQSISYQATV